MDTEKIALLIPIISVLVTGAVIIYAIWTQNKERLAMIEKGIDPLKFSRRPANQKTVAKWGMLFVGIALGIIVGALLIHYTTLSEPALMFSSIIFFGGISLLIFYFTIGQKKDESQQ